MGFFRNVFAWVLAAMLGYLAASTFSTHFVLADLAALGAPITIQQRISTTLSDLLGTYQYLAVILLGYAVAFFVASLVKAMLPMLGRIAYPVAGAFAIWAALSLMEWQYGTVPIGGGRSDIGFLFQILAGGIGGLAFEVLRPKKS